MNETEKLAKIRASAEAMGASADEYAVGLAAEILATIDGSVTAREIDAQTFKHPMPDTVGDALKWAIKARS